MPRSSGVPGAGVPRNTGSRHPVEPPRKRKRSPSDERRDDARSARHTEAQIESKVHERHEAWSERDPLARRHMPAAERHIASDELPAKDWTRPDRTERLGDQIADLYVDLKVVRVREERP